jgi:hypothetical protein
VPVLGREAMPADREGAEKRVDQVVVPRVEDWEGGKEEGKVLGSAVRRGCSEAWVRDIHILMAFRGGWAVWKNLVDDAAS